MREDSLKKRYSIKLFASIISGIIGAILIAIVPKALGPIAYGQFVYLQDFFMKIIGFLDMGSSIAFFTKLSARATRKELITFYFIYAFLILLIISTFIGIVKYFDYTNYILPDIPIEYVFIGLFFGFFTWFTQIFIKISDAYALTVSVELIKIGHKIVSLFLLLYFIYFTAFNLEIYFYFHYIALFSFLFVLTLLFIKKDIFSDIFNFQFSIIRLTKEFIEYCQPLVLYSIAGVIVGLLDIWLLQKYAGSEQTGFYGLAYSLAAMCFIFTSSMTPIITREFSKSYEQKDIRNMRKLFFRYIPMLYSLAAYFGVFISMQSETVLAIFTDDKFQDAYLVLAIMAFYPVHQTYGQLSGSIFYATGQTKLYRNIGLISMLMGIILSFLFIYLFDMGAVGLAWKMILGQVIGVNIQLYYNAKFLRFNMMRFISHQIYSILFFVVLAYISTHIFSCVSNVLYFLISGILYTIFVIIWVCIFPQIFATNRNEIKNMFNKMINRIMF